MTKTQVSKKTQKVEAVKVLVEKLEKAKAVFLTDYKGITHQQLAGLRKALRKVEAEYVVTKNTLLKIAMRQSGNKALEQLEKELNNPTATLLSYGDEIKAVKELAAFIKTTNLPKIKLGLFAGSVASEADFTLLASLPTRDVLLATLAGRLSGPLSGLSNAMSWNIRKLVYALDAIKGKKPSN